MEEVILVDFEDRETGRMEKEKAHREAKLHRAFSVFLHRGRELLIQKRAAGKYHCGGLWTNTCCSHPRPGETVREAAVRRLKEKAGIRAENLEELYRFFYYAPLDHGFTEFECDHVLVGEDAGDFHPDPREIEELRWVACDDLKRKMMEHPEKFTPWFLICAPEAIRFIQSEAAENALSGRNSFRTPKFSAAPAAHGNGERAEIGKP